MILTIITFIAILAALVLIHELGHFIAAKKNGVMVEEFGFGFPPRLFGFKRGETLYSINLLPIGGFVKVYGEEYHEEQKQEIDPALRDRAFVNKKPWQKASIVVAGIVGNFLLAWVLISYLFTQGVPSPTNKVIVEKVSPGSPAAQAGIRENSSIEYLTVGGTRYETKNSEDLIALSKKFAGKEVVFHTVAGGAARDITIVPRVNPPKGQGPLGVTITSYEIKKFPWYSAPFFGLVESFKITQKIVVELTRTAVRFFSFQKTQVDVAGPIGIAQFTGQAIKFGSNAVLELMALLSLNLAVINILPFPALDGGRLAFIVYEWVTRRRVNTRVEQYANLSGMIVLLSLAALITVHDIMKLMK